MKMHENKKKDENGSFLIFGSKEPMENIALSVPNTAAVLWIRIGFNADPDFYLNADPDPAFMSMRFRIRIPIAKPMRIQANPDPGHS